MLYVYVCECDCVSLSSTYSLHLLTPSSNTYMYISLHIAPVRHSKETHTQFRMRLRRQGLDEKSLARHTLQLNYGHSSGFSGFAGGLSNRVNGRKGGETKDTTTSIGVAAGDDGGVVEGKCEDSADEGETQPHLQHHAVLTCIIVTQQRARAGLASPSSAKPQGYSASNGGAVGGGSNSYADNYSHSLSHSSPASTPMKGEKGEKGEEGEKGEKRDKKEKRRSFHSPVRAHVPHLPSADTTTLQGSKRVREAQVRVVQARVRHFRQKMARKKLNIRSRAAQVRMRVFAVVCVRACASISLTN